MDHRDATHAFCPVCKEIESVTFEALDSKSADGEFVGGDVVCNECLFVIVTLYKERQ